MKDVVIKIIVLLSVWVSAPVSLAHQPRIVQENPTVVLLPEVSKAYYGTLNGKPSVFTIKADKPFALYVGVLVPDIAGQKKDVSAVIFKDGKQLAVLNGANFSWQTFFEEFGHDTYWKGPEYKSQVEAGTYEIRVTSLRNDSQYSLAIGEIEAFDFKEGINALTLIPKLKKEFFKKSPVDFVLSPFGWGLILTMFVAAFLFGFIYRFIFKKFTKKTNHGVTKNRGIGDRVLRALIGSGLLLWAITTTWSPWLLFFSGFAFFEAIFSWCGPYAAFGKKARPVR